MGINRRKFIQNTSFGFLGSLIPFQTFSDSINNELLLSLTLDERLKIAADKRKQGYINKAINKFTKIVEDYPDVIRAYDGLRKSLLQKKYKELKVLQLYETGLINNPGNKDFKERLAKEYMRLILGNKKFTDQYNSSENILVKAKGFFKELKNEYPERPEYLELFKKAKRKINQQADILDARSNFEIKAYKKDQRIKFKKRFKDKTDTEIESKLNLLLSKPQTETRKTHIKELYRILIKRNKTNQNWQQTFLYAMALFNFDKTDPLSLKKAKRFSVKTNNFNELVNICQENHNIQNTFWSKLSLFDAQLKRYSKTGVGNLALMSQLLSELNNEISEPHQIIEIHERTIRLAYKQQNLTIANQNLLSLGELLVATENAHLAIRYTVLVARYFNKKNEYANGIKSIKVVLGESEVADTSNELLLMVADVNQEVTIEKVTHINRLNKVLEKLYNGQNP